MALLSKGVFLIVIEARRGTQTTAPKRRALVVTIWGNAPGSSVACLKWVTSLLSGSMNVILFEPLLHELSQPRIWAKHACLEAQGCSIHTFSSSYRFAITNTPRIAHGLNSGRHIRPDRHTGLSFDIFATNALGKTALFTLVKAFVTWQHIKKLLNKASLIANWNIFLIWSLIRAPTSPLSVVPVPQSSVNLCVYWRQKMVDRLN